MHVILLQLVVHTSQYHITLWWNSWIINLSCHPLYCLLICPWSHRGVIGEWVWPLMWLIFVYKYIASVISLFGDVMGNPSVLYNNTCECMEQFYCIVCVGVWYVSVHHMIITSWWFHQTGQLLCNVFSCLCTGCHGFHICRCTGFSKTFVVSHAHYLSSMPAMPLSVCTLDGVTLKGASHSFQCLEIREGRCHTPSADFSQSINNSSSPDYVHFVWVWECDIGM